MESLSSRSRVIFASIVILGTGAAIVGALSLVRVPADQVVVIGDPPHVLSPGTHFAPPGADRVAYPLGEISLVFRSEELHDFRLFAADGAELEAVAALHLRAPASPSFFVAHHRDHPGREPAEAAKTALRAWLRQAAAAHPADSLLAWSAGGVVTSRLVPTVEEALAGFDAALDRLRFALAPDERERQARASAATVRRKVLMVGVDAADWDILQPLIDRGLVPHFARMVREGTSAPLRSIKPLLSPLIWTSIATGVSPEQHGILDFVSRAPDGRLVPVASTDRRAPALWNLIEPFGKRLAMVAWLATYPAEAVPGALISDRFGFVAYAGHLSTGDHDPKMTWPPELSAEAEPYRVVPEALDHDLVRRFVHVPPDTLAQALAPGFREGLLVNNLIHTLAAAETSRRLGTWLWGRERPDLGLFYFEMVDAVGHLFMPYAPPRLPWVSDEDYAAYRDAMDAAYIYQDEILGDFLRDAGDSTLVMVVSDHGFRSGEARPREGSLFGEAGAARWHQELGVLILHGAGVRPGLTLPEAHVLDLAPTIMAYLGCPPTAAMEGRVLRDAFSISLPADPEAASGTERAQTELGDDAEATTLNNLGLRRLGSGDPQGAIEAFQHALARDASLVSARNNLATALMQLQRHEEAEKTLEKILEENPDYALSWMNLGLCRLGMKRPAEAVAALERAAELEPRDARVFRNLGFAALEAQRGDRAREAFARSLELEETASGHYGHGIALAQAGLVDEARRAMQRALELDPDHGGARRALESLRPGG